MRWLILLALLAGTGAYGAELTVHLPDEARSASSVPEARCTVEGKIVHGTDLSDEEPCTLSITLKDGTILQGVDMGWYAPVDETETRPMSEEDRAEIEQIVQRVPSFYDKSRILLLQGTSARAVALVELIRDREFHASNGNVIWRVELWYFQEEHGGWSKVQQQNKVLRRERFKNAAMFREVTTKIRWIPALGGIRFDNPQERKEITVE